MDALDLLKRTALAFETAAAHFHRLIFNAQLFFGSNHVTGLPLPFANAHRPEAFTKTEMPDKASNDFARRKSTRPADRASSKETGPSGSLFDTFTTPSPTLVTSTLSLTFQHAYYQPPSNCCQVQNYFLSRNGLLHRILPPNEGHL